MIIDKLLNNDHLTSTDQAIRDYIMNPKNDISTQTSYELAEACFTSQAAIIRFYKRLGLKSYREFMSVLQKERQAYFYENRAIDETVSTNFTSLADIQETLSALYNEAIRKTNIEMDANVVTRICNRILNYRKADIYALGISYASALQMTFKMQSIGIFCQCHDGINQQYLRLMKNDTVAIVISQTGKNEIIHQVTALLKERGIYTAGLLGVADRQLIAQLDDYLLFDVSHFDDIDSMYSTLACDYVINVLYAMLIHRLQLAELLKG